MAVLVLIAAVLLWASGYAAFQPAETVRVAIFKGAENLVLEGNGVLVVDEEGQPLDIDFPVKIRRDKGQLSINGFSRRKIIAAAPGVLKVNGKGYRGTIEVSIGEKGLLVVDELPLEDYLVGLINCEISSQWPIEAVKSQAVIARTYALFQKEARKGAPYHLESSVLDQVYEGCDIEDSRAVRGVRETAGEVLTNDGSIIQAFYHSSCGGRTEAAENVWGFPLQYMQGVDCKYCVNTPSIRWSQTLGLSRLETALRNAGNKVAGLRDIRIVRRNKSGRIVELSLDSDQGQVSVSGVNFRKAVGYSVIKSTNFELKVSGDEVIFSGAGYGHGVGLCQWGSKNRALEGFNYREILSYYYPGTKLVKHSELD
ncbi:MAG: SpoIID/LytB domain-containing protein [Geobacter sp.]|nr:SpoIID/LytB domain-containing protein [Geobacter sp.]